MISQISLTWSKIEEFATIKHLKKQLTKRAKRQRLSEATWKTYHYWLTKLFKFAQKTPDELIEFALKDPEETENLLIDFKNWCIDNQKLDENTAINGTHGCVRGFFRHNNVITQNWITPAKTERKVGKIDDTNPIFLRHEKNGKKRLVLDRELLREFQSKLNYRDQIIMDCLISSGLDDGDLLKLDVGFVRNQNEPRLFLNHHRSKTLVSIRTFFSLTASKLLRHYVATERAKAIDEDPLFITTMAERKKSFRRKYGELYDPLNNPPHLEKLPDGKRLIPVVLATNFRHATENMGIHIPKGQQSPLRPKRLRKVFESACTHVGLDHDLRDLFMGHTGSQSKTYQGKSREELEYYYEMVEPKITIQVDEENDEIDRLQEEVKKFREEKLDGQEQIEKFKKESVLLLKETREEFEDFRKQKEELLEKINLVKQLPKKDKELLRKKLADKKNKKERLDF